MANKLELESGARFIKGAKGVLHVLTYSNDAFYLQDLASGNEPSVRF